MFQKSLVVHMAEKPRIRPATTLLNTTLFHSAILLLCVGCASEPQQLPNCDIPAPMAEVQHALELPELPVEVSSTLTTATFNLEGMSQLKIYRIASDANKTVADENALALEARNEEVNALIECARFQNVWIRVHAEDLKDEKFDHFIDNLLHRGLIALGVVAVAL